MHKGAVAAFSAYALWGLFPLYWKAIQNVSPLEIIAHRMVWSFVFVLGLLLVTRQLPTLGRALRHPRSLLIFLASALLLSVNWFIYVWGVNNGHIVDTSLGYFINPLISVLLGVVFLKERLRLGQAAAVALALGGVVYLTLSYGVVLWIALSLALSFGLYGLLRKIAPQEALVGLSLETLLLCGPALIYLVVLEVNQTAAFGHRDLSTSLLLAFTGVATGLPLLLFGYGARRVTLITLGILQYIAPTLQFLLGVLVYGEAFTPARLLGFSLIWVALAVYTLEAYWRLRHPPLTPALR